MGSFDEAINQERERAAWRADAKTSAAQKKADAAQQADTLIREAAEKFAPLPGLQLFLVRPRKFFDRGKPIISTTGDNPGTYTAVDTMRCWSLPQRLARHGHIVLTERGHLATIDFRHRIHTHTESAMVVAESHLRTPHLESVFRPSGDMTGLHDLYVTRLRDVLARTFVTHERTAAERVTARRR